MKILVLSDSHSTMGFMRACVEAVKPQAIVHLGDHYDDGKALGELYPHIGLHLVPGNCDRYRCPPGLPLRLCYDVCGVRLFMTHGHTYGVKSSRASLLAEAGDMHAQAVLYGHTHMPECYQREDGMWVMNPGSSGYGGRSGGLIEVRDGEIITCRLITREDLEEFV